jgi:hypothetical protein
MSVDPFSLSAAVNAPRRHFGRQQKARGDFQGQAIALIHHL